MKLSEQISRQGKSAHAKHDADLRREIKLPKTDCPTSRTFNFNPPPLAGHTSLPPDIKLDENLKRQAHEIVFKYIQGGAMNRGLLFAGLPPPPLGGL
jgi:hypothetical protein